MFYEVPFSVLGFSDEEWEEITPGDRRLIRDHILNGWNETRTILYNNYDDDSKLRKVVHKYKLNERPRIKVSWTSIHLY